MDRCLSFFSFIILSTILIENSILYSKRKCQIKKATKDSINDTYRMFNLFFDTTIQRKCHSIQMCQLYLFKFQVYLYKFKHVYKNY